MNSAKNDAKTICLVINVHSGSYVNGLEDRLSAAFADNGWRVETLVRVPQDDLPDAAALDRAGYAMLAIYGGDGTINAGIETAGDWDGPVLVLPGGTMNFLVRVLHGDPQGNQQGEARAEAIIARACAAPDNTRLVPCVRGASMTSYVGIIAGPTTAWNAVREAMRRTDLEVMAEAVPFAFEESTHGAMVGIAGDDRRFPAVFIEPHDDALHMLGFHTEGLGDFVRHGLSWLKGDFRDGPHDRLGEAAQVVIIGQAESTGLLIDGEKAEADLPLALRLDMSRARLIATRRDDAPASP